MLPLVPDRMLMLPVLATMRAAPSWMPELGVLAVLRVTLPATMLPLREMVPAEVNEKVPVPANPAPAKELLRVNPLVLVLLIKMLALAPPVPTVRLLALTEIGASLAPMLPPVPPVVLTLPLVRVTLEPCTTPPAPSVIALLPPAVMIVVPVLLPTVPAIEILPLVVI